MWERQNILDGRMQRNQIERYWLLTWPYVTLDMYLTPEDSLRSSGHSDDLLMQCIGVICKCLDLNRFVHRWMFNCNLENQRAGIAQSV